MVGEVCTVALKVLSSLAIREAAPTITNNTLAFDVRVNFPRGPDNGRHTWKVLRECSGLESLAYFLAFLYTIRQRPPGHISRLPFKEIGHKVLILVPFVAVSKDISARMVCG